jgi:hypothetical protein
MDEQTERVTSFPFGQSERRTDDRKSAENALG